MQLLPLLPDHPAHTFTEDGYGSALPEFDFLHAYHFFKKKHLTHNINKYPAEETGIRKNASKHGSDRRRLITVDREKGRGLSGTFWGNMCFGEGTGTCVFCPAAAAGCHHIRAEAL